MTQRWDDYLRKPITEEGLAGIRLGDPLNAVLAALGPPRKRRSGKVPAERMEILEYTGVAVIFHDGVVDGVVDGLIAEQPYVGESAEHLRVGMTWRELVGRFPHVYFSERYVWCIPEKPWFEIDVGSPLRPGVTSTDEGHQWGIEWHEVYDVDGAFVTSIAVTRPDD